MMILHTSHLFCRVDNITHGVLLSFHFLGGKPSHDISQIGQHKQDPASPVTSCQVTATSPPIAGRSTLQSTNSSQRSHFHLQIPNSQRFTFTSKKQLHIYPFYFSLEIERTQQTLKSKTKHLDVRFIIQDYDDE